MKKTRIFSDLSLRFTAHPVTGDVSTVRDEDAIKASVRNLVLTNFYERKFHPEIGSHISSLLFEPYSVMTDILIRNAITETVTNFEPRVNLIDVIVNASPSNNLIFITVEFKIINTTRPITLNMELRRTR